MEASSSGLQASGPPLSGRRLDGRREYVLLASVLSVELSQFSTCLSDAPVSLASCRSGPRESSSAVSGQRPAASVDSSKRLAIPPLPHHPSPCGKPPRSLWFAVSGDMEAWCASPAVTVEGISPAGVAGRGLKPEDPRTLDSDKSAERDASHSITRA